MKIFAKVNYNKAVDEIILKKLTHLQLGIELCYTNSEYFLTENSFQADLKKKLSKYKIPTVSHLPFYGIQFGCIDSNIAEFSYKIVKSAMDSAIDLGISQGVLHLSLLPMMPFHARKKWLTSFLTFFDRLLKYAENAKFTVLLENTWEEDFTLIKQILEIYNSRYLRACLDIAHVFCFSKTALDDWVSELGNYLTHIHLSDNNGDEDSHLQIGKGSIPYDKILPLLKKNANDLTYTLETEIFDIEISVKKITQILNMEGI
ncbi:MAG: sugar phosphate isomerase/epimerase [Candidatus Cloacimonetes bacterium]|nr:sugar phosphate isomerase/epimerase [Candidatus Cloacimonadota bacterium]